MIQWLRIKNFKQFEDVHIPLGDTVVFVGPNNSGKTSALQALSLWQLGLRRWKEKRGPEYKASQRSGVAVNRRDLTAIPIPSGKLIWRNLNVRHTFQAGKQSKTEHVLIEITVGGQLDGIEWQSGFTFDYTNEESFYVRPVQPENHEAFVRDLELASRMNMAYMPPMSGLASNENLHQPGTINVLIGQGQTAQVLRNLCYQLLQRSPKAWEDIVSELDQLYGCKLSDPTYVTERGEISLGYRSRRSKSDLDISSAGRGFQQTLLLLTYICLNENSVLLLDEPDAHLEVLRQRQIFELVRKYSSTCNSQIVAASHSEVILNEAANTGRVIAFIGVPHDLTGNQAQLRKALTAIGWEDYFLAEQKGWILYVEDSTDLRILKEFADVLKHPANEYLDKCMVVYVGSNIPMKARDHFYGLKEAKSDLVGFALFDRLDKALQGSPDLVERMWTRREIENYFASAEILRRWVGSDVFCDLFSQADRDQEMDAMNQAIQEVEKAQAILGIETWSDDVKASDDVLDRIFRRYFEILGKPLSFRKSSYSELVRLLHVDEVPPEVSGVLDELVSVAARGKGLQQDM